MAKQKTHDEFVKEVYDLVGDEYTVLSQYVTNSTKIKFRHNCENCDNYEYEIAPSSFTSAKKRCVKCRKIRNSISHNIKAHEKFVAMMFKKYGGDFEIMGEYKGSNENIKVKHITCGAELYVLPSNIANNKYGCKYCANVIKGKNRVKSQSTFEKDVLCRLGEDYVVISEYKGVNEEVEIYHKSCNRRYNVTPASIYNGAKCIKCSRESGNKKRTKTNEEFLIQAYNQIGNEYTFLEEYGINSQEKIRVTHNVCGHEYSVAPNKFLMGRRCPNCKSDVIARKKRKTLEEFKREVFELEGENYTVLGEYKNARTKTAIKHESCGNEWLIAPDTFLHLNVRCPLCKGSNGEAKVAEILNNFGAKFVFQYSIDECRSNQPLPFDFAIIGINEEVISLIEYDGIQHFEPIEYWGGKKSLKSQIERDNIKNEFCEKEGILLLRIPYWEYENVDNIVFEHLLGIGVIEEEKA